MIQDFFSKRYTYLKDCAKNILFRGKKTSPDLITDLVSECFVFIHTNKEKLTDKILDGQIEAIAVRWMDMANRWSDTNWKNKFLYPKTVENGKMLLDMTDYIVPLDKLYKPGKDENINTSIHYRLLDESSQIDEEDALEVEKAHLDLYNCYEFAYEGLPAEKRVLFNIIYRQGHNTVDKLHRYFIKNHIKESRTNSYYLLKEMRDYFKSKLNDLNNNQ